MSGSVVKVYKQLGGNGAHPETRRLAEKSSQTFLAGTPVVVEAATGYLIASPAISSAITIAGFAQEPASNLSSSGVRKFLTYGSVENQTSAVLIAGGGPINDGKCGVWIASDRTLFIGNYKAAQTPAVTDIGLIYGMVKDGTSNLWYIDTAITAAGSGAICEIVELLDSPLVAAGRVSFRITRAGQQFGI